MPSDRAVRWSAFAFSIFFVVVVSLGYIPGLNATPHVHNPDAAPMASGEHMMMGLYVISLLDDVTHALSAIVLLVGALHSARVSRLALTAFGWYYAYDATIYIVTGILQQKPLGPKPWPEWSACRYQLDHAVSCLSWPGKRGAGVGGVTA